MNKNMFEFDVLEINEDLSIVVTDKKKVYNTDKTISLSEWLKDTDNSRNIDSPFLSSYNNVKQNGDGKLKSSSLGYFHNNSNNVYKSGVGVALFSSAYSDGHGTTVSKNNLHKVFSGFTARKLIQSNWINQKDEFLVPNEEHEQFEQFKFDSIVYSLFNSASAQSSLRQVEYKEQLWDIKNEFFWMSAERMKQLADDNGYDELYNDARTASDRHVYKLLFGEERIYNKLSDDAKAVLDKATELVESSMELRQVMANDENHLNSWDAGYAQLKLVWKEYFQEDFTEFRRLYKVMEERMRPLVYELGFLMK